MSDKSTLPDLSEYLKSGLKQAILSYEVFKKNEVPSDAKGFTAYHNACKAALMHIALLVKLFQGQSAPSDSETDWLQMARDALAESEEDNDVFSA